MGSRANWLVPGAWALMAAVSLACGSLDPGAYTLEQEHGSSQTGPAGSVAPSGPTGGGGSLDSGGGGPKKHTDAGGAGHDDAGSKAEAAADAGGGKDVATVEDSGPGLFGASAYKGMPVAMSAAAAHTAMGGPKNPGFAQACLSCHNGATKGTVEFLFAGSIYTDATGATGAVTAEVRVVDSKGVGTSAYSDANGNFWMTSAAALSVPGQSGARDAVDVDTMPSALSSGDCNSCHNNTAQPVMHLP